MLEQVREPGLAGRLVLGADIVPDGDRDDRRLAVGMNDNAQAVGQSEGLERDVDCARERGGGDRRGLGNQRRCEREGGADKRQSLEIHEGWSDWLEQRQ